MVRRLLLAGLAAVVLGAAAAPAGTLKVVLFKTPSGNIGCIYTDQPSYLRCDIRSGLKPKPRIPQTCSLDYGDSVSMNGTGKAHLVCHGDTALDPRAKVVSYGSIIHAGQFTCTSKTSGLTCKNASGHGWFLSRQSYRLF